MQNRKLSKEAVTGTMAIGILESEPAEANPTPKQQRETDHFVFYCTDQDVKALDDLVDSLENCYEKVTSDLGKAPSDKTRVDIYPDIKTYHDAIGRPSAPDWAVGEARSGCIYVVSPLNPGPAHNYDDIIIIAVHEYTHIVVEQFNRCQPTYLNEGIACYEAGQTSSIYSIKNDMTQGTLPSLTELENYSSLSDPYTYSRIYIDFVVETFGFDKVVSLLEGKSQTEVFGISTEQLNEKWIAFLIHYVA